MIIVELTGGLGNQMFQYAAGRALARRHNTTLKLDVSRYSAIPEGETPREYQLDLLSISSERATDSDLANVSAPPKGIRRLWPSRLSNRGRGGCTVFQEHLGRVNSQFFSLPDNTCLCGYWQSERYFQPIGDLIRREFEPAGPWSARNRQLAAEMADANSVSLHVRRTDYVTDERTRLHHGTCSPEYYATCMAEIADRIGSPHFFLFSDDPDWVRDNITTPFPKTVVDHNASADAAVFDLKLMSLCKHNIIANSSFSWWGAWLNGNPGKIVLAPSRWFALRQAEELLPHSWIKI